MAPLALLAQLQSGTNGTNVLPGKYMEFHIVNHLIHNFAYKGWYRPERVVVPGTNVTKGIYDMLSCFAYPRLAFMADSKPPFWWVYTVPE
jgi:hypothetical protein